MSSINPDQQRPMTAIEYAENWGLNSADIDRDGGYAWMARQIAPPGESRNPEVSKHWTPAFAGVTI